MKVFANLRSEAQSIVQQTRQGVTEMWFLSHGRLIRCRRVCRLVFNEGVCSSIRNVARIKMQEPGPFTVAKGRPDAVIYYYLIG